jgi:hypothetical protein
VAEHADVVRRLCVGMTAERDFNSLDVEERLVAQSPPARYFMASARSSRNITVAGFCLSELTDQALTFPIENVSRQPQSSGR